MNISKFFADKPRIVVVSAILTAIGLYFLAEQALVPWNRYRVKEANEEIGVIKSLAQAKKQDVTEIEIEQFRGNPQLKGFEKLNKQLQELQQKYKIPPLGYWDAFPPGHPYGAREPDDIIIFYPRPPSSFSGTGWGNRSIFDRIEERNAERQEPTHK
jgi:hypothetical protein